MFRAHRGLAATGLVLIAGVYGCDSDRREESGTQGGAVSADTTRRDDDIQDAQIVNIVMTANTGDSALGAFARPKAQSAAVRDFAQRMVREHTAGNVLAGALVRRMNVTPAEHGKVRDLQNDVAEEQRELAGKTGRDFDHEYIEHEIAMHEDVLEALDDDLIPDADNAELRQLLTATRATVSSHLEQARRIKETMGDHGDSTKRHN